MSKTTTTTNNATVNAKVDFSSQHEHFQHGLQSSSVALSKKLNSMKFTAQKSKLMKLVLQPLTICLQAVTVNLM